MSGINKSVVHAINRLKSVFVDDIGNICGIQGTGFWVILSDQRMVFVTNRHNVDPRIKFGINTKYTLREVSIELHVIRNSTVFPTSSFFLVKNQSTCLYLSDRADCALLCEPAFGNKPDEYKVAFRIQQSDIADEQFIKNEVQIMDFASFIGFPGDSKSEWWDQSFNLPIARLCSLASMPEIPFKNSSISSDDVTLVSGFSFSGSSGSPVILHQKGIKVSDTFENSGYVPPKVLGIMSGHTIEIPNDSSMFQHTGLSYFTRSTSILALIRTIHP